MRGIRLYLGHKNSRHTVLRTELSTAALQGLLERLNEPLEGVAKWPAAREGEDPRRYVTAWSTAATIVRTLAATRLQLVNAQTKDFAQALVLCAER
jgi:hypothetical protein